MLRRRINQQTNLEIQTKGVKQMKMAELDRLLEKSHIPVESRYRNGNATGWCVRTISGTLINVYDTGTVNLQGKNTRNIKRLLDQELDKSSSMLDAHRWGRSRNDPLVSCPAAGRRKISTRAVLILWSGADPAGDRVVRQTDAEKLTTAFVPDVQSALITAIELVEEGAELIELCGGFAPEAGSLIAKAVCGRAAVGTLHFRGRGHHEGGSSQTGG